jgi:hypothetical protein
MYRRKEIHPITSSAIFAGCSTIRLLSFWNAEGKSQKLYREKFDELKQEVDSILKNILEAELISVSQT